MTKVFLAELNPASWQGSFEMGGNRMDPIAIGYISSYLRSKGLETKIFQQRKESDEEVAELIRSFAPDYIGFSVMTCCVNRSLKTARNIKKILPRVKTIFGGYHPTGMPEILSEEAIDFVVLGEGEKTCYSLIEAVENNRHLEEVGSIGFKQRGKVITTARRPRIKNLDSLPFPERYRLDECSQGAPMIPSPKEQKGFAQITWSRGCLHNCSFCNSPNMWERQVHYRSPKNVVDEIEYLQNEFGTNTVFFTDLTFNENRERVIALCREIKERRLNFHWSCSCRVTDDKEMLKSMKEAGCVRIGFGIESLDDRVLSVIGKGITVKEIKECIELANNAGIISRGYFMIGYSGQTQEDINLLKSKMTQIPLDLIRISFLTPFPGTASFKNLDKQGAIVDYNWDHYDCDSHYVLNAQLKESDLFRARQELFKEFYSNPRYKQRIKEKARRFPELMPAYEELSKDIEYNLVK